ncbi:MAG: recombinase family protein [Polyangiaceae bacterium]
MTTRRAALYYRVSSDEQSTECQRPEVEQLCRGRGLHAVAVYEEQASAAKHRPMYEKMLKDAKKGVFNVLIVWAIDRFGRSMTANLGDILELDRIGVQVVSVRETWLDTGGPVRNLLVAIFSWVRDVLRQALEVQRQADKHEAEVERIKREVELANRRISNVTEGVAEAEDGAARAPLLAKLKAETARRTALLASLAEAEAVRTTSSPDAILGEAERRVHELRDVLAKGGIEALPAVRAIMGDEKFKAKRTPEGWAIKARISTAHVYEVSSTQRCCTATRTRTAARRRRR